MAWSIPAALFVCGLVLTGVVWASPPAREPLPEVGKPRLHREETPLEKAVGRAAFLLESGRLPPSEDAVRFALWMYSDRGEVSYRNQAESLARKLVKQDPAKVTGGAALYWVAQAGGGTLEEAKAVRIMNEERYYRPGASIRRLAFIAAMRDSMIFRPMYPVLADYNQEVNIRNQDLATEQLWLSLYTELVQLLSGSTIGKICVSTALDMVARFQDKNSSLFVDGEGNLHRQNARAALAVWDAGFVVGDSTLMDRGRTALESDLEAAVQDSNAVASVGLAAARMSRHPLQIAIIGNPADSTVTALRQAAYFLFAPDRMILNLDPARDAERLKALMYPPEVAPAAFVCVGALCSPPIKDPAELEKRVAEIRKLAAEAEQ